MQFLTYETACPLHSILVNETEERIEEILEAITESTIKYVGKYWQCKAK
jgi:hypothetical protein